LVIVPTYRRPEFLAAALRSVLSQSGATKQIIVVDDCPDGSAREVVTSIDPGIIYLKNPQPSGGWPAKVRNYGFETSLARGIRSRFVHFLDDDDTVPDGHYEHVKQAFAAHPNAGVMFGVLKPFAEFSENWERRRRQEAQLTQKRKVFLHAARVAWIYHHIGATLKLGRLRRWLYRSHAIVGDHLFLCSGAMIRHEHVVALGGFNPNIRITEDYEFFTRAILAHGAHFLGRVSANYRVGSVDSLWNPLELSQQGQLDHFDEAQRFLTARYLRLQSDIGVVKFKATRFAFERISWLLDTLVIPVLDHFELATFRRDPARRTAPIALGDFRHDEP
jgi:glycosyltransferase involved in cell wall biosynthesis